MIAAKTGRAKILAYLYLTARIPVFLWGDPGTGKTSAMAQLADAMGRRFISENPAQRERVDFLGVPSVVDGRTIWNPPAKFPRRADGGAWLILWDEFNAAERDTQAALWNVPIDNAMGDHEFPRDTVHVYTGNFAHNRSAGKRLATAAANRMAHVHWEGDPSPDGDWQHWAAGGAARALTLPAPLPAIPDGAPIHPIMRAFIRHKPAMLNPGVPDDPDVVAFASSRTVELVSRCTDAPDAYRLDLFKGLVQAAWAEEYERFVFTYRNIPDPLAIVADPDGAPIPGEPSTLWALIGALSTLAKPDNIDRIMRYAARLPEDKETLLASDIVARVPALLETPAMVRHKLSMAQWSL